MFLARIALKIPRQNFDSASQPYVLVVEDEFFSRMHAADLVEAAGYRAIEVSNADEAIAILEARKDIRIVLTDIDMPGSMDGLKLARAIEIAGRQSNSFLPRVILMCRRATFQRGVYFFPSHIVMKRLYLPYEDLLPNIANSAS